MKIFPDKKLLGISFVIALVLNFGKLMLIDGLPMLIAFLIDTFIYAILVMIVLRVVFWIGKKAGLSK